MRSASGHGLGPPAATALGRQALGEGVHEVRVHGAAGAMGKRQGQRCAGGSVEQEVELGARFGHDGNRVIPKVVDIDPFHPVALWVDFCRQSGVRYAAVSDTASLCDAAGDKNRPALRVGHNGAPGAPGRQWAALARHMGAGGPAGRRAPRLCLRFAPNVPGRADVPHETGQYQRPLVLSPGITGAWPGSGPHAR